jgi:CcmD family protein
MILGLLTDHGPTTPDTTSFMYLGFGVIFTVIALHLFSLYRRRRSLKRDLELLEEIQAEES